MNAGPLVTLLLLGVVFYLFLIAPQRRRQRQTQAMTRTLEPGTEVMTTAGLFATVRSVHDDEVELEIAPGVVSRYAKGAVARVIPPLADTAEAPDEGAGADDDADAGTGPATGRVEDSGDEGPTPRP